MQNTYLETEKHEERKNTTREGSLLRFLIFFFLISCSSFRLVCSTHTAHCALFQINKLRVNLALGIQLTHTSSGFSDHLCLPQTQCIVLSFCRRHAVIYQLKL